MRSSSSTQYVSHPEPTPGTLDSRSHRKRNEYPSASGPGYGERVTGVWEFLQVEAWGKVEYGEGVG